MVLFGDLLRAQVFLDRQWIVGPAFHGRIVGDDHALEAVNAANARDDAGARHVIGINLPRGVPTDLQEVGAIIEKSSDAISSEQLAALEVFLAGALGPTLHHVVVHLAQVFGERLVRLLVLLEVLGRTIDLCLDYGHQLICWLCTVLGQSTYDGSRSSPHRSRRVSHHATGARPGNR